MAVCTLPFLIPMILMVQFAATSTDANGNPVEFPYLMFYLFPFLYLVFGYISVAIGSLVYNFFQKFIGGFEFEITELDDESNT